MALILADRVRETTLTSGAGPLLLAGAQAGFRTFSPLMFNGDTTYYTCVDSIANQWEVGLGLYSAGFMNRQTVLASSNSGALVVFAANPKDIFMDAPASILMNAITPNPALYTPGFFATAFAALPTSLTGLLPGQVWNNGGFICIAQ